MCTKCLGRCAPRESNYGDSAKSLPRFLNSGRFETGWASFGPYRCPAEFLDCEGLNKGWNCWMLRWRILFLINDKVSSTETGVIFGNILWEGVATTEACVILNDMHIDIMDYIRPASCNESQVRSIWTWSNFGWNFQFRSMWTEFEWENRVNISTNAT